MTLVRLAMDPSVTGILLGIGFAGLVVEMLTLSLFAGTIAAASLAVFFTVQAVAGSADPVVLGLAAFGLAGILVELHVLRGHGVSGIVGVLALFVAIMLAFGVPMIFVAVQSLAVAIVVGTLLVVAALRVVPEKMFVHRLTVRDAGDALDAGYPNYDALVGRHGVASSYLRPAGVAAIDGQRRDVLTEGEFVPAGAAVVVTRVQGARIFVRPEAGS